MSILVRQFISRASLSATAARSFASRPVRKILVPTKLAPVAKTILEENHFQVVLDDKTPIEELLKKHQDAYGLIVRSEKVDEKMMEALPGLKVICRAGAGFNTIDIKAARKRGIDVMNTPGANANAVAEEVVAMILAAFRHVVAADNTTRAGQWEKSKYMGRELAEKTVGVVGLGAIGQLVVKRLQGFECKFVGYDPVISSARAAELGVKLLSMEDLFSVCDVVTLHMPATPETKKIINKSLLEKMKDKACLVNCARVEIVDEDDLRAVKKEKKIFYCTDVYKKDEAGDKPVKDIADIMLPHLGANTTEANTNAAKRAAIQINEWNNHGIKKFVVNKSVPEDLEPIYQKLCFLSARIAAKFHSDTATQPSTIETSFYGNLNRFQRWLTPSVVLGLSKDFDPTFDAEDANVFLKDKGITYNSREVDDSKNYGESVTIDLLSGQGSTFEKVSVRGTVTEGRPMISRINNFDHLYFNPIGHIMMVEYKDRPGVLAAITQILAKSHVNILDLRAPQDHELGRSLAVLSLSAPISRQALYEIKDAVQAFRAIGISLE